MVTLTSYENWDGCGRVKISEKYAVISVIFLL